MWRDVPDGVACGYDERGISADYRISIRFLPYIRASRDHAPGPSIARLAPSADSKRCTIVWSPEEKTIQSSTAACEVPAKGVHKPTSSKPPTPIATNLAKSPPWGIPQSAELPPINKGMAAARRRSKRPVPGHPPGNTVNSRCKFCYYLRTISHSSEANVMR